MADSADLMDPEVKRIAYLLTDAIAAAAEPRPDLDDINEWIGRRADDHYTEVQRATFMRGEVPAGMAREIAIGRKAVDLLAKIIERQDEVLFLLRAKPRNERSRR